MEQHIEIGGGFGESLKSEEQEVRFVVMSEMDRVL